MPTVGRLKQGDLFISGEVDERVQQVQDGLVASYPLDGSPTGMAAGHLYRDRKVWSTADFVPGRTYPLSAGGNYPTLILEAEVFLTSVPSERFTVLQTPTPIGGFYLSIDSSMKVSAYDHSKTSQGYHASTATLTLNEWHKIAHIGTPTQTIIMVNGVVDRVINNAYRAGILHNTVSQTLIGAENTGRHFQGSIKNMKIGSVNPTDLTMTNVSLSPEGSSVEESTTNMLNSPAMIGQSTIGTPFSAYGATYEIVGGGFIEGTNSQRIYQTGTANTGGQMNKGILITFNAVAGQEYHLSFYGKGWEVRSPIGLYAVNLTTPSGLVRRAVGSGWTQYKARYAASAAGLAYIYIRPNSNTNYDFDCLINAPQLEQKGFATSFTEGSRGAGRIDIPFGLNPPYTVNVFHRASVPLRRVVDQGSSPMIFQMGGYHANASISVWNFSKVLRVYMKGNAAAGWTSTASYQNYTDALWDDQEHMYTLVAVNNRTFQVYMDGQYLGQQTSSEDVTNISFISMGNTSQPNATYRDMSIYNRALTSEEVQKTYGRSFSLQKEGSTFSVVKERKQNTSGYYFPYDNDQMSLEATPAPLQQNNLAFDEGALWAGSSTLNYAQHPVTAHAPYYQYSRAGDIHYCYRQSGSTSTTVALQCSQFTSALASGTVYTISGYLYLNGQPFQTTVPHISTQHTGTIKRITRPDGYFAFTQPFVTSGWTIHSNLCNAQIGDTVEIRNMQMEIAPYASAFTPNQRGQISLSYSPSLVTGSVNFAFSMWVKSDAFTGSYNMPLDIYPHLYVSLQTNRALFFSFTNNGAQATMTGEPLTAGRWHHIAAIKTTTSVQMFLDGKLIRTHTASGTGYTSAASRFHVGSYGGSYPLNGYIRDFEFESGTITMTAQKIEDIYKKQMSARKGGIIDIQGQLREGKVL